MTPEARGLLRGMGSFALPGCGGYDTWLTPRGILHALGTFDLDPCAAPSPRPWPTAERHIELPEDGLRADWGEDSRVFLNPPYGRETGLWLERMAEHPRGGIALVFARTETDAWQRWIWPHARGVLFIDGRLNFHLPDGTRAGKNAGAPSALVAYGRESEALVLRRSGIAGWFVGGARATGGRHGEDL